MQEEFSAGGIVYRKGKTGYEIVMGRTSAYHTWVFPKGHIGDKIEGETKEQAAIREVQEETGIMGKIVAPLTPITYWFQKKGGKKVRKTVYFFLMEYVSGDTKDHDFEMDEALWIPIADVESKLTYTDEIGLWREAKQLIQNNG